MYRTILILVSCGTMLATAMAMPPMLMQHNIHDDLHAAIARNDLQSVDTCLQEGADPNLISSGYAPIHNLFNMKPPLLRAVSHHAYEICEHLLAYKADVNQTNFFGDTPLLLAVDKELSAIVKLLLKHKASTHHTNCFSW